MFSIPIPLGGSGATKKRKRDVDDDEEDNEALRGPQALPVANLPDDFDGIPQDGAEYLFTVRRDARALPRFTRAHNAFEGLPIEAVPNIKVEQKAASLHPALPSVEWRDLFQERFTNMRKNFAQPTIFVGARTQTKLDCPAATRRDDWWKYISGIPGQSEDEGQDDIYGDIDGVSFSIRQPRAKSAQSAVDSHEPTPAVIKSLDHRSTLLLLLHFRYWLNCFLEPPNPGPNYEVVLRSIHARWIFSLLAHLDDRLLSDEISTLREIARRCLSLAKEIALGRDCDFGLTGCWMVIGVIAGPFGQRDLWMDAEDMFRSLPQNLPS